MQIVLLQNFITKKKSKQMPKEKAPCKCLSIIMLDSVIKANKKHYPQTFLEECKYEQKIKTEKYIDQDLKSEPDIDNDNDTDNDE